MVQSRIHQLDGLRGLAVLFVIAFHLLNNAYTNTAVIDLNPFELLLSKFTSVGWTGVNLFFVLSGFLIATSLLNNRSSSTYFSTFYIRRFARIVPIYFLLLLIYLVFENYFKGVSTVLFEKPIPIYYYFLFFQNFIMSAQGHFGPNALTPSWSLAVEEQFYLVIPFIIYWLNDKKVMIVCLTMICVSLIYRSFSSNWYQEYTHFLSRMDAPCFGILAALYVKNKEWISNNKKYKFLFLLLLILLVYLFGVIKFTYLNHTLIAVAFFFLLLYAIQLRSNHILYKLLTNGFLKQLGYYSYFIYLYHQLINGLFFLFFDNNNNPHLSNFKAYSLELSALFLTYLLSRLSYKFIESKFLTRAHKFNY